MFHLKTFFILEKRNRDACKRSKFSGIHTGGGFMQQIQLCPKFETAFEILGRRWTGLIINVLLDSPKRFKDISEYIPNMSDKMLVDRLKQLEASGIIVRKVFPDTPVRIEYQLTEKGKALQPVMTAIQSWAEDWVQ